MYNSQNKILRDVYVGDGNAGGYLTNIYSVLSKMGYKPVTKDDNRNILFKFLFKRSKVDNVDWGHYKKNDINVTFVDKHDIKKGIVIFDDGDTFKENLDNYKDVGFFLEKIERNRKLKDLGIV